MVKKSGSGGGKSSLGLLSVLRVIVHLTGVCMFSYGIYYNFVLKFPKRPGVTNDFAGKMKYLTTINAVSWKLQFAIFCVL